MRFQFLSIGLIFILSLIGAPVGQGAYAGEPMQAREATTLYREPAKDAEQIAQLMRGALFDTELARNGWLSVKRKEDGVVGWLPARAAEPVGGCHEDRGRQLDFMLKHHGAIAFNEAYQEFGAGRLVTRSVGAGHRTHTRKSLRDAMERYLPDTATNADTAMLLPYVGPTALCLLAIDAHGVRGYAIQRVSAAEVEAAVDAFVEHLAPRHRRAWTPNCEPDMIAPLQGTASYAVPPDRLAKLLLPAEIEHALAAYRKLIIVPHGMLAIVPYGALRLPGTNSYFIERFAFTIAPGLTQVGIAAGLHRAIPRAGQRPTSIVVGDPKYGDKCPLDQLPGARHEAREVARAFGTKEVVGEHATIAMIRAQLRSLASKDGRLDVLHLATHAIAHRSTDASHGGFLALADGDRLTVTTLQEAGFTGARLVVLSACQTGLGWIDEAGTIGLARAFHLAGAHEVVMSLWDLPDLVVPDLMIDFARKYAKQWPRASAATTLRQAVLDYKKSNPGALASVWAAYSVFGVGPF
jgi:CHAT domain/Bacterial dipeptidyl-peptidase Sh3 domain